MTLKAMVASQPKLEQEFAQVQQQIAASDRDLEEAQRRHDEITYPLQGRLQQINDARRDASEAGQELFETCDDQKLEQPLDEASAAIDRLLKANQDLSTQAA